ncbi:MAG: helix-turn-helix transcriptional regulator [Patescibacteria group bacterium]|nr:helix-turn-helix transcriptional regulator [Patescibacteria group bacterium]MDD4304219.1 helix-turn-helix transcriptional regulator [Patescibacteria group bacterium]MDD4695252.1 helix-turn-helix transcriptional regulator [Patescibacteria group bacterium]
MNKISKKLGQNLKKIRTQKGISQGDISRKLDMDRGYISRLENGMKNPTLSTIQKIADFLDVSVNDLMK